MSWRVAGSREEGGAAVTEHVEIAGQQLHRPVPLERWRLALGKSPVDLSLLDQECRGRKQVDIADMVAMSVRNGDKGDVRGFQVELAELSGQLLRARCMANGCVDRPVGNRVRVAGVPKQPLLAMLDQHAHIGHLDRLADIDPRGPARLIFCRVVSAIHYIEAIGRLRRRRYGQPQQYCNRQQRSHDVLLCLSADIERRTMLLQASRGGNLACQMQSPRSAYHVEAIFTVSYPGCFRSGRI